MELGAKDAASVLRDVAPKTAASILEEVAAESLTEITRAINQERLVQILPEMSPRKFFQIAARVLFDKLPDVPVEQLALEIPPVADPDLPPPVPAQASPVLTIYTIPRTGELTWTKLVESPGAIGQVLGKFNKVRTGVTLRVEQLAKSPAALPKLAPRLVIDQFFRIDMGNAEASDLRAVHMTLSVAKSWLEKNGIHKWSVQVNRYDAGLGAWVPFSTKRISEDEDHVVYTVVLPGFSVFALTGSSQVPEPAFQVANLVINPTLAFAGELVEVSVRVRNGGAEAAVYPANLWINDTIEQSIAVTVEPGQTRSVSFFVRKPAGSYRVRVERLLGDFNASVGAAPNATEAPAVAPTSPPTLAAAPTAIPQPTAVLPAQILPGEGDSNRNTLIFIIVGVIAGLVVGILVAFGAMSFARRETSGRW